MIWYWLYRFVQRHREWREYHEVNADEDYLLDALDRYWARMPQKYRARLNGAS